MSTALVTGASRGLGRAVAIELARRGHEVVASMRQPDAGSSLADEAAGLAGSIRVEVLDVCDPDSIRIPDGLGVLVNNAAVELTNESVEDTSIDAWREMFETNLFGLVEVTRRAIPSMRAAGGGVICNVSSVSLVMPTPFYATYRASKAAVSALGESLRVELAPFRIRVVEVLPGPIDTDMLAGSSLTPEAVNSPPYRALAEHMASLRAGTFEATTPVESAASAIADGIEDDDGPHRISCDPLGTALLDEWEKRSAEASMRAALDVFSLPK